MSPGTPPPDPLYKYAKAEHAEAMIKRGRFAVGTLYDFRNEEKHGKEVGDAGEGTRRITQHVEDATWDEIRDSPLVSRTGSVAPGSNVRFIGAKFISNETVEDLYVFCMSREPTKQALVDFGKDVCVRIDSPLLFIRALSNCLLRQGKVRREDTWVLGPCEYADREMVYGQETQVDVARLKPLRFAYQKEYRAIWPPNSRPIQLEIIKCPEARRFLRIHPL